MDILSLVLNIWIYLSIVVTDATFLNEPVSSGSGCIDGTYNFPWSYSVTPNSALSVVWMKDSLAVVTWVPVATPPYIYGTGYNESKVEHNNNNGEITIKSLNSNDAGVYICRVTYASSGTVITSNDSSLVVSSCTTSNTTSTTTQSNTTQKPTALGVVIGSVIGVVAFILITILVAVSYFKRRN